MIFVPKEEFVDYTSSIEGSITCIDSSGVVDLWICE